MTDQAPVDRPRPVDWLPHDAESSEWAPATPEAPRSRRDQLILSWAAVAGLAVAGVLIVALAAPSPTERTLVWHRRPPP